MIPMLDLKREYEFMKQDIDAAISRAMDHQAWIMGPEVKELETRVAEYIGTRFALGCASGTDALVLALRALAHVRHGKEYFSREDEVITTSFTFTATGDAIIRAGATPVFADIELDTFNISPALIRAAITPRTVGIVPVHLYGQACVMDEITSIAREHGLFVVEDVAQAFGAGFAGRKCGAWGDCGAFSFFPSKNLGSFGDAGMVTTSDPALAAMVDMLRRHGGKDKYNVDHLGYNSRLDTLQAAVLLAKLKHLDTFNSLRRRIARHYSQAFASLPNITPPAGNGNHVYHQYTVRSTSRDRLADELKKRGIATMVYYPVPLHKMKVFAGRSRTAGPLDKSEQAAQEVLSLPIEPLLSDKELAVIVAGVAEAAR
ncbi:MAG: DegT/DnrJ/EryC1/StrS family aminotransferase [candidate division WOR-3 bacterium]